MTGESMHTASEMMLRAPAIAINYRLKSEVSITLRCQPMFNPLHMQHFGSRTVRKAPLQSIHTERKKVPPAPVISIIV